jgi:hypothetical protein
MSVSNYNRKTSNDIVETTISDGSGYRSALLNLGQISNKGIEFLIGIKAIKSTNFDWNVSSNTEGVRN